MKNFNVIGDSPFYSESLNMEIRGRKHFKEVLKTKGARILESGEKIEPRKKPYELNKETKKELAYLESHGVNWNFIEKRCPQLLPKLLPKKK